MTHAAWRPGLLGLLAIALICSSCGGSDGTNNVQGSHAGDARNISQGKARAKAVVEEAANLLVPGRDLRETSEPDFPCTSESGEDLKTSMGSFSLSTTVTDGEMGKLLAKAARHWRQLGMEVGDVDLSIVDPALSATEAGYHYFVHIVKTTHVAEIGATTPCLPALSVSTPTSWNGGRRRR